MTKSIIMMTIYYQSPHDHHLIVLDCLILFPTIFEFLVTAQKYYRKERVELIQSLIN